MKILTVRAILFTISLAVYTGVFTMSVYAEENIFDSNEIPASALLKNSLSTAENDLRSQVLKTFLEKRQSPLADYADTFIQVADKYELDWKLVPAISGLESAFAKRYVQGTYNAYGWGGGYIYFDSWEDSIETVSAALKDKYINRGALTVNQIGRIYAPPNPAWGSLVIHIMTDIDKEYQNQSALTLSL